MSDFPLLLFLTSELPYPPHQGMAIRVFNFLTRLRERHRIHLFSLSADSDAEERAEALRQVCERVEVWPAPRRTRLQRLGDLLTSRLPDMALRAYASAFQQGLREALRQHAYQVVHVESIEMARYALEAIRERQGLRPFFVFDDLNAEYLLQKRAFETDVRNPRRWMGAAYSLVQWRRLARYERAVCRTLDRVVAVSDWDREALLRLAPDADIHVVPNGIDTEAYLSYEPPADAEGSVPAACSGPVLAFTGKMDFRPNVDAMTWFCGEILPRIRAQVPEACLYIVGQRPTPSVQKLAEQPGVVVTGFVPDVRPYVAAADVYVVPMRMGGGTRLKVLEAMTMGKAVVSTALGCEGYGLTAGREVALAETPEAFAAEVLALLRNLDRRLELGANARAFVVQRYDWGQIAPLLERAYAL